jgi:hypothetical protein
VEPLPCGRDKRLITLPDRNIGKLTASKKWTVIPVGEGKPNLNRGLSGLDGLG